MAFLNNYQKKKLLNQAASYSAKKGSGGVGGMWDVYKTDGCCGKKVGARELLTKEKKGLTCGAPPPHHLFGGTEED